MRTVRSFLRWPMLAGLAVSCCLALQGDEPPRGADERAISITSVPASEAPRIVTGFSDDPPGDQRVNAALRTIVSIRCRKVPIGRFAVELEQVFEIPVRLADEARTGDPLSPETRVSLEVHRTSLTEAIHALEGEGIVAFEPAVDRGMLILSVDRGDLRQTLLYDVAPLKGLGVERVVKLIKQTTYGPWDEDEPGTGLITVVGSGLLIRTTCRDHRVIERFLALLEAHLETLAPPVSSPSTAVPAGTPSGQTPAGAG